MTRPEAQRCRICGHAPEFVSKAFLVDWICDRCRSRAVEAQSGGMIVKPADMSPELLEWIGESYAIEYLLDKHERLPWAYFLKDAILLDLAGYAVLVPRFSYEPSQFTVVRRFADADGRSLIFELRTAEPAPITDEPARVLVVCEPVPEQAFHIATTYLVLF